MANHEGHRAPQASLIAPSTPLSWEGGDGVTWAQLTAPGPGQGAPCRRGKLHPEWAWGLREAVRTQGKGPQAGAPRTAVQAARTTTGLALRCGTMP